MDKSGWRIQKQAIVKTRTKDSTVENAVIEEKSIEKAELEAFLQPLVTILFEIMNN